MGTDQHTFAALYTDIRIPDRNLKRQISFLPACRSDRVGAIHRKRAHGQRITPTREDWPQHSAHKFRGRCRHWRWDPAAPGHVADPLFRIFLGNGDIMETTHRPIDRIEVHSHHIGPFARIGPFDRFFDCVDRLLAGQHTGQAEEAGLHHGVDPTAHAALARHAVRVNRHHACPFAS